MNAYGDYVEGRCVHMVMQGTEDRGLHVGVLVRQKKGDPDADGKVEVVFSVRMLYRFQKNATTKMPDEARIPLRCHGNTCVRVAGMSHAPHPHPSQPAAQCLRRA